jgi:hypothetical protein
MKKNAPNVLPKHSDGRLSHAAKKRLFPKMIAHYAQCEPKYFLQLDGHFAPSYYEQTPIDLEGDYLDASRTLELMSGSTVRVLIPWDTHPKVAIRQLKKMAKLLQTKPELMDYAMPDVEDTQAYEDADVPF